MRWELTKLGGSLHRVNHWFPFVGTDDITMTLSFSNDELLIEVPIVRHEITTAIHVIEDCFSLMSALVAELTPPMPYSGRSSFLWRGTPQLIHSP